VLQGAVQGIAELITRPGLINVDFADVRTVMSEMGMAMMGTGVAKGEDRAREAAEAAISSPLLEDINLAGAKGILVNVTAGMDLSIGEFEEVGNDRQGVRASTTRPSCRHGHRSGDEWRDPRDGRRDRTRHNDLDSPPGGRRHNDEADEMEVPKRAVGQSYDYRGGADSDLLDIPAFLRRQAD
jgi:cell division protein FtsZ